jgi:hypothetical protein
MMKRLLPLLLLISSTALAESGAYRVEIIVFRNLDAMAEPVNVVELRGFSQFPGLEEQKVESGNQRPSAELTTKAVGAPPGLAGGSSSPIRSDLPDDLDVIKDKGFRMDDAWRRLRSSQGYRPLLYASWEQNRTDYYPPMRIHDQTIIDSQLRPPTTIIVADLATDDPLAAYRSIFYKLDGSVQLRRSRFLHLFLDLEYRQDTSSTGPKTGFFTNSDQENGGEELPVESGTNFFSENNIQTESGTDANSYHRIFRLKQNRQIRTDRMQYFDTPYFGVLVLVSTIQEK